MLGKVRTLVMIAMMVAAAAVPATTASAALAAEQGSHRDDAQPRAENLQFHLRLTNFNNEWLNVDRANLAWGKWCEPDGAGSPRRIPPFAQGEQAFCAQGRRSSASGTEGTVAYVFKDDSSKWFSIYFEVPWGGKTNKMDVKSADNVIIQCSGFTGSGKVEDVTCKVDTLR